MYHIFYPCVHVLSSPRAKGAGLKGLHAESARAVTGRRCPHSGVGEDFLARWLLFFLRKRAFLGNEKSHNRAKGPFSAFGPNVKTFVSRQKNDFWSQLAFLVILGQIPAFLVHCYAMPDQETMGTRCLVGILICEYQNFRSLSKTKFCLKYAVLVNFGQILAFLIHMVLCLTKKQCKQGA